VKTYWTENGNGAQPQSGIDVVGGNIVVEVAANAPSFTITYAGTRVDTYPLSANSGAVSSNTPRATAPKYAWSKNSKYYHHSNCRFVQNIAPANLEQGDTPPAEKTLHANCPI
jgi:hypothetical protein